MYKELTASQLTRDALLILKNRGVTAWRNNNHATRGRRNNVQLGVSDIIGYHRFTAIAHWIEVKKIGDKLSPEQVIFLSRASKAGCICMIATQGDRNDTVLIDFIEYITK